jgi:hypothetical protein
MLSALSSRRGYVLTDQIKLNADNAAHFIVGSIDAGQRAMSMALQAQTFWAEEAVFLWQELSERSKAETHLLAEFASKLSSSHSVAGLEAMYRDCCHHQLQFMDRDWKRLVAHGNRLIDKAYEFQSKFSAEPPFQAGTSSSA